MPDPDPNKEPQQPLPASPGGQQMPPEPEIPPELQELTRTLDATKQDEPAVVSNLHTREEVAFQLELEGLRIKREKRLAFTWTRRSFAMLIALMVLIALVSAAAVIAGLGRDEKEIVLPSLASMSGAGAAGALLCRSYINRLNPEKDDAVPPSPPD